MGNVVAPQSVMNSLGADILRLWVASSDYSAEMNVSQEILKAWLTLPPMRNTVRFLLGNLGGFDPVGTPCRLIHLWRWIAGQWPGPRKCSG